VVVDGRDGPWQIARAGFLCATLEGDPQPSRFAPPVGRPRKTAIDDPYRFGPRISAADLYLHTEARCMRPGARSARTSPTPMASPGFASPCGRQRRKRHRRRRVQRLDTRRHPCGAATAAYGKSSSPVSAREPRTSTTSASRFAGTSSSRPTLRLLLRDAAQIRSVVWDIARTSGRMPPGWNRAPRPTG